MLRGTPIQYDVKKNNRFILEFPTDLNIESWLVQSVTRPKITINRVEIDYNNTSYGVAGKYKWEPMDIEFIDPIGPSSSQKVMEWVRLHAESLTGRMGYAAGYKKDIYLIALDPNDNPVEKWALFQCQITSADFGTNNQSDDELQKPEITIHPDFCELMY